jgi:protein phosphatase
VVAVLVLALVVGGGIGTYAWALQHWFVGVTAAGGDEQVGVFRGLNTSIVGLDLYRLDEETSLAVSDLTPAARSRVTRGITADDAADADRILDALREQRLPLCPPAEEPPADGTASAPATRSTPRSSTGAAASTATPGTRSSAVTGPSAAAPGTAAATSTPPSASTPPSTSASATASADRTSEREPGVDCREAE